MLPVFRLLLLPLLGPVESRSCQWTFERRDNWAPVGSRGGGLGDEQQAGAFARVVVASDAMGATAAIMDRPTLAGRYVLGPAGYPHSAAGGGRAPCWRLAASRPAADVMNNDEN